MKNIIILKLVITLTLIIPNIGMAQKTWTLDECIAFANENNLENIENKYASAITKENFQQSKRNFLPEISAFTDYSKGYGRYIDPNSNDIINTESSSSGYSIGSSMNLFNSFRKWNTVSQKRLLLDASKESILQTKYELAFAVMDAFYLVKFQEGLLQVAEERLELSKLNYKTIAAKVKLGLLAKSDLYEIESELAADKFQITKANNQVEAAMLDLMQKMNFNGEDLKLQTKIDDFQLNVKASPLHVEATYNKAVQFLPVIMKQELIVSATEKGLAITRSNLYPSINLNARIRSGHYETNVDIYGNTIPFFDQISENSSKYIGISMRIPITNKWQSRSQIKIAKIEVLRMNNNLEQKKQEVYKEIQKVLQKNESLVAEKQENESNLKSKELAFTIVQKKFEKGIANIYELQQSKNDLTLAKIEKIRIELQLKYQRKTIDFYNGISVFQLN